MLPDTRARSATSFIVFTLIPDPRAVIVCIVMGATRRVKKVLAELTAAGRDGSPTTATPSSTAPPSRSPTSPYGTASPSLNAAPYGSGILGPDTYHEAPQQTVEKVRAMLEVCRGFGVPLAAALQFSMRDPRIISTIVGMSRPERVEQTLDLAAQEIPNELWERLDRLG